MKPFLQGRKTLAVSSLQPAARALSPVSSSATKTAAEPCQPHVETIKEGDKIVRLVVTCGCGERVEIECLYPAGQ